ncbi:DUF4097 family beta strand repeat-containing protein [Opitutus sp. ER46]|uniref:DUF4097 family beta strand repeat-containing protein n=1 Tax=Opitutus sp. ER46 TaxID=2161864 RepID=UPI000D309F6C|nr:DUF4097 family beta strand repeat-containing protein [Opitutus sp. ER46]PTX95469.1 hypothetical protein DB354_08565 [Opitutus sp. ER46]
MKLSSLPRLLGTSALLALAVVGARADDNNATTVKFSDPAKPGTLRIKLARGDLKIRGADTPEVVVNSDATPQQQTRKDGLRVLTAAAGFNLKESNNVITLDAASDGWMGSPSDFDVTVPRGTNVVVSSGLGGDIDCRGVTGDIEIKTMHGEINLDDVRGAVLVETMNGEITANLREIKPGKSVSFVSTNGPVVLRVPADAKANVRLRTHNGSILTDFDEKALVTKVEATAASRRGRYGALNDETREAIRQAGRASAEAGRRAAEAVREAAEAARHGIKEATGEAVDDDATVVPPVPPVPPMPPIPVVTGGKLVTGVLNGGGPEISVTTMNGDVTVRKLEQK